MYAIIEIYIIINTWIQCDFLHQSNHFAEGNALLLNPDIDNVQNS